MQPLRLLAKNAHLPLKKLLRLALCGRLGCGLRSL